jgi:spore maturation protein CgeB
LRWLIGHPGPHFSVHDLYEGWTEALRGLGEQVFTFNLGDRISFYSAAYIEVPGVIDEQGRPAMRKALDRDSALAMAAHEIIRPAFLGWPDVVLLISAFWYPPYLLDVMRGRGMQVVLLHTESPYQDGEQLERAAHADINLINDPVNIEAYRDLAPAEYMPHAFRPSVHYPALPGSVEKWDFSFIGTGFPSRVRFFEAMDLDGLDVKLDGPWLDLPEGSPLRDWTATSLEGCVDNADTAEIYRQSRTSLNFYRRESEDDHAGQGWAMGPREVELAACGTWFTRDPRPESDELFPMLPSFTSPEEASDQIRWALAHPDEREKAAGRAREAVAGRTFEANAKRLLQLLDN